MTENNLLHLKRDEPNTKSQRWYEKQNRRIQRHSKYVFLLKTFMPICAGILFVLVFIWPNIKKKCR